MHFCHEELLAVVNAVQQVFPGIVTYITRFRTWWHARRGCSHPTFATGSTEFLAQHEPVRPQEHSAVKE